VDANASELQNLGRRETVEIVTRMFMFAALSAKHPGFKEEREWRVIYSPRFMKSDVLIKTIQSVHGVPQIVYKIPFEPRNLINRVIIGPSQYPSALYQAFVELLAQAGVSDPESKVCVSHTPLRVAS
jgi:hypothetical protein